MGIVIRQSFWSTVIAYVGVLVGYFNTLYFRPEYLELGEIGLFTLVTANAMLISPFCTAGMPGTFIKYFPDWADTRTRNQFFTYQVLVILALNAVIIVLGFLGKDWIADYFSENSPEYVKYLGVTAVVIVVNSLFDMLFSVSRSQMDILVPSFLRDIFLRLGAILLVAGLAFNWWSFEVAMLGIGLNYVLAMVILLGHLMFTAHLRFSFDFSGIDQAWKRKIFNFGWYSMLLALSFAVLTNVSYMQVAATLGDRANGIFTTCFFIGLVVEMPSRNMMKILSPMFSKSMQAGDMEQVKRMYQKGSITMSVFGALLVIGILTNLNDLFAFIPQGSGIAEGFWVVVAVCCAKMALMLFGPSQEILVYSPHYKVTLYFQIGSAIALTLLNVVMIPTWGLSGAGLSYMAAILAHSVMKYLFVWRTFRVSPFTEKHVPLLLLSAAIFLVFWFAPFPFSPVINILVRSALTTVIFVFAIWKMNISPDINQLITAAIRIAKR